MPEYAESESAPDDYGFPIFYELLSLDEALASEEEASEDDRDTFGESFDSYLAGQLKRVRATYAGGYVWGTAFSARAPEGEFSSAIPLVDLKLLSKEQYQAARARGWLATEP